MPFPNEETQFKPGQSGNPAGRPKKIYKILRESGFSIEDIRDAFAEIGWQKQEELEAIMLDPEKPVILKVIAKAFLKGSDKGDYRYVREILEQTMGKPKEQMDVTTGGEQVKFDVTLKLNG